MKKLISALLLISVLLPSIQPAFPSVSELDRALVERPRQLLTNGGWEQGKAGWTASGGTYTTTTSAANVYSGSAAGDWDSNSASQTLIATSTYTNGGGPTLRNMVASCYFKCASGSCTHTISADDGSNNLSTSQTITSSTTGFVPTSVNFLAGTGGTVRLKISAVASNEPELFIDGCYLGSAEGFNLSSTSQAQFIGSAFIANTASCEWGNTNTSLAAFATTSACPGPTVELNPGPGIIQTTDTDLPQFTVNNLSPGTYRVLISGGGGVSVGAANLSYAINDGTTSSGSGTATDVSAGHISQFAIEGWFTYTTGGNKTFALFGATTNASDPNKVYADLGKYNLQFSIVKFPTQIQTGYKPDQTPASWSGFHSNNCSWTTTSTSFADPTDDATCTFTETYNRNFGTVTTFGSSKPGVTFTPPRVGRYFACAVMQATISTSGDTNNLQLVDGTGTVVAQGAVETSQRQTVSLCGVMNVASIVSQSLKTQMSVNSSSFTGSITGASNHSIDWSIIEIDAAMPTPFLTNGVSSARNGVTKTESAKITYSSGYSLSNQSDPAWTLSNPNGAGRPLITFHTNFSDVPQCVCTAREDNVSGALCTTTGPSTSTVEFRTRVASSLVLVNESIDVVCTGAQ